MSQGTKAGTISESRLCLTPVNPVTIKRQCWKEKMSRLFPRVVVSLLMVLFWGATAAADYKADIGFTQLQSELGGSIPTGAGVTVTQVEAGGWDATKQVWVYLPDHTISQFNDKNFIPRTEPYNWNDSIFWHATNVGQYFYGTTDSIAPGITSINNYLTGHWLEYGFLNTGYVVQPWATSARVANHSWVGSTDNVNIDVEVLKRLDWVINRDEYIQVVGMNNPNNGGNQPLLGSSFNAIAVGLSNGTAEHGSYALDSLYTAGRTRPDLVAPAEATSWATPVVGAAAALLVQVGHAGGTTLSTDPAEKSTTNRNGDTIYNAERSEVVKAALMAGASRTASQLTLGYTVNTNNGLNSIYGAGQLNIYNSYHIIAAGEQNSKEDPPGSLGTIGRYGFDYDPYFGGLAPSPGQPASNRVASYYFKALNAGEMTASLVWNLEINGGTQDTFDASATFYHLGLYLYDLSDLNNPVAYADGTADNTENLWWTGLAADHNYLLQVSALTAGDFLWDYGLAWDISTAVAPVPIPGAVYLLGSGILVLVGFRRKFTS